MSVVASDLRRKVALFGGIDDFLTIGRILEPFCLRERDLACALTLDPLSGVLLSLVLYRRRLLCLGHGLRCKLVLTVANAFSLTLTFVTT